MSLVRTALILSVAIAVLPSDRAQQERVYQNVAMAANWTATYCDRNPATCENASAAWASFLTKAEFAGHVAYTLAVQYATGDDQNAVQSQPVRLDFPKDAPRGTLTSRDLEPQWRGSKSGKGI